MNGFEILGRFVVSVLIIAIPFICGFGIGADKESAYNIIWCTLCVFEFLYMFMVILSLEVDKEEEDA